MVLRLVSLAESQRLLRNKRDFKVIRDSRLPIPNACFERCHRHVEAELNVEVWHHVPGPWSRQVA
jgi:hypothetical protein